MRPVPAFSRRLMRVNNGEGHLSHMRIMVSALLRALTALSLMLMPLGAAQAAVLAADAPAHAETAIGHCSDQEEPGKAAGAGERHCTSCTADRAVNSTLLDKVPMATAPAAAIVARLLLGLELEIATPPPRQA